MQTSNTYMYHRETDKSSFQESEESVYNLIEKPASVHKKEKMYRSQYPKNTPPTASTFGLKGTSKPGINNLSGDYNHPDTQGGLHSMTKSHATMGRVVKHELNPGTFLKKGDKTLSRPKKFRYQDHEFRKPAVPKRDEKPIMGLITDKNFVVSNAVEVILAQPQKQKEGTLRYTQKPEYGRVPEYLEKIKQEVEAEKAYIAELQELQRNQGGKELRLLTEDEQQRLLDSLKDKWTEIHKKYQAISFSMPSDKVHVNRKEALEVQMDEIERDIERLSKKHIYIYENEYDEYGF